MIPWCTDARDTIRDLSLITEDAIEETTDIRRFLRQDRFSIIVATKGFGKSLLLLAKRKSLVDVHHVVPHDLLLDVPAFDVHMLTRDAKSIVYDSDAFGKLWEMALLLTAVRATRRSDAPAPKNTSDLLSQLLLSDSCKTVAGTLNALLRLTRREFTRLREVYGTTLIPHAQDISETVAIFIDNFDECLRDHGELWYAAQSALIDAVYRVSRINPRIKLYVAVRKEAYLKHLPETEMALQYEGVCLLLQYSKSELRDIFDRNVRADSPDVLTDPSFLRTDAVHAFIGARRLAHGYVMEDEDAFDYIYRHTLRRPRDFMEIGAVIARTPIADRKPDSREGLNGLKTAINYAGSRICDSYLAEVLPHLDISREECERMCGLIDSNVLPKDQVKKLCMVFNGGKVDCQKKECTACRDGKHVFCELYKAGLIGVVIHDPATGSFVQQFPVVGERLFAPTPVLPDSDYYLIHPVLDDKIRSMSAKYRRHIDSVNIVGYDRPWRHSRVPPDSPFGRPIVFVSSTMDLKQYRDLAEDIIDEERFEPRRSEYENSPESLVRMRALAAGCHIFVAILGARYGEAVEGKSVCEREFEAAFADNPEKILVYALDVPAAQWDTRQSAFLERIQSLTALRYARGERVTTRNFKQRFQKDILERIARLIRNTELTCPAKTGQL